MPFLLPLKEAIGEKQSQNPDTTAMLVPDTTPETPANEIFPVGYGVSKPRVLYGPNPPYTETAKIANLEGTCILALVVDSSGLPGNIEIQKPLGYGLDEQAIATVETWRFRPGVKEGRPVAVRIMVQLSFQH